MSKIVFSDVDGTLLNSAHVMPQKHKEVIAACKENGIPFVIVSARSPSGIYPLVEESGISGGFGPICAHGGGLILDESGEVIFTKGMEKALAAEIIDFVEREQFAASWCLYSYDQWLVRTRNDPRIVEEETIVRAESTEGDVSDVTGDVVHKILCICDDDAIDEIERRVKERFPMCKVVKSWITQLEILPNGVDKSLAVTELCRAKGVAVEETVAFGDNYNDEEMLSAAGRGYLMANAPQPLKERGFLPAKSNDEDGIYHTLKENGWI